MSMQITITPDALAEIAKVLDCRKSYLLSGYSAYGAQQAADSAERAVSLLTQANPDATGLAAMLREVEAIKADEDGEFAAMRSRRAMEADALNGHDKANKAHLAQTLNAIKLERQHSQIGVAA